MDPTTAVELSRNALWQGLLIGGPLLAVLLLVGIVTAVAQTVTNVHDVSVSFIPKLLVLGAVLLLGMPWLMSALVEYTRTALGDGVRPQPAQVAWSIPVSPTASTAATNTR